MKKIIFGLVFGVLLFTSSNVLAWDAGCSPLGKYSTLTGNLCSEIKPECSKGDLFSYLTGKSCAKKATKSIKVLEVPKQSIKEQIPWKHNCYGTVCFYKAEA